MSFVTIMCDASWCPNTGAGGYGFWIASDRGKLPGGDAFREPLTSPCNAEIGAVINSIIVAHNSKLVMAGDEVLIQTDCVEAITILSGRKAPSCSFQSRAKDKLLEVLDTYGITCKFRHVKGHTKNVQARYRANNHCDQRAKQAMRNKRAELLCHSS